MVTVSIPVNGISYFKNRFAVPGWVRLGSYLNCGQQHNGNHFHAHGLKFSGTKLAAIITVELYLSDINKPDDNGVIDTAELGTALGRREIGKIFHFPDKMTLIVVTAIVRKPGEVMLAVF